MKKIILGLLFGSGLVFAANEYKQPNAAIFYSTLKIPLLNTAGVVTNTSGGQLGTTVSLPVANGGTNATGTLFNNRIIVSSGGTIGETAAQTINKVLITNSSGLPTTETALAVSRGGTNSAVALNSNRMIISSGGTIGETVAQTINKVLITNSSGLPTTENALAVSRGGTNSAIALNNNRVIVSSGGTIGELASAGASGTVLTSNGFSSLPTFQTPGGGFTQSEAVAYGLNGAGSSNTQVAKFANNSVTGSDITYTSSATNGDSFTINTAGVYAVAFVAFGGVNTYMAITKNQVSNSTGLDVLIYTQASSIQPYWGLSVTRYFAVNDVIRGFIEAGAGTDSSNAIGKISVTRVH